MTTWVLLRGLMRETRHWDEFPQQFQSALNVQHVVPLDFPGNGSLHAQTSATNVREMANHCRTQLKRLGRSPPYCMLALSLGGMVAVAWSELYPDEIERMVLINTSLAPYNPLYQRLRPANYPALFFNLFFGSATQRERLILDITSSIKSRAQFREEILQRWIAYARECPVTRANILRQLRAATCFRSELIAPTAPVLLLAGQQDRLVNVKCSIKLAQQWHCAIRFHPDAGHDLPLDDSAWVTRQVKEWLET